MQFEKMNGGKFIRNLFDIQVPIISSQELVAKVGKLKLKEKPGTSDSLSNRGP